MEMSVNEKLESRHSLDAFMLLCFYINLRCYTTSFKESLLMGNQQIRGMDLRPLDGAAGAMHAQNSRISVNIVWNNGDNWQFFSIFPYGIQIQVHFHCGHSLANGNQQLLVTNICIF